jgi:heme/copper-type cytochrome/quinol oxidase subunit 1
VILFYINTYSGSSVILKFIILILPAFGIYFTRCCFNMRAVPSSDMKVCIFAMATIGVLGFLVWAHHNVYCRYDVDTRA